MHTFCRCISPEVFVVLVLKFRSISNELNTNGHRAEHDYYHLFSIHFNEIYIFGWNSDAAKKNQMRNVQIAVSEMPIHESHNAQWHRSVWVECRPNGMPRRHCSFAPYHFVYASQVAFKYWKTLQIDQFNCRRQNQTNFESNLLALCDDVWRNGRRKKNNRNVPLMTLDNSPSAGITITITITRLRKPKQRESNQRMCTKVQTRWNTLQIDCEKCFSILLKIIVIFVCCVRAMPFSGSLAGSLVRATIHPSIHPANLPFHPLCVLCERLPLFAASLVSTIQNANFSSANAPCVCVCLCWAYNATTYDAVRQYNLSI